MAPAHIGESASHGGYASAGVDSGANTDVCVPPTSPHLPCEPDVPRNFSKPRNVGHPCLGLVEGDRYTAPAPSLGGDKDPDQSPWTLTLLHLDPGWFWDISLLAGSTWRWWGQRA